MDTALKLCDKMRQMFCCFCPHYYFSMPPPHTHTHLWFIMRSEKKLVKDERSLSLFVSRNILWIWFCLMKWFLLLLSEPTCLKASKENSGNCRIYVPFPRLSLFFSHLQTPRITSLYLLLFTSGHFYIKHQTLKALKLPVAHSLTSKTFFYSATANTLILV